MELFTNPVFWCITFFFMGAFMGAFVLALCAISKDNEYVEMIASANTDTEMLQKENGLLRELIKRWERVARNNYQNLDILRNAVLKGKANAEIMQRTKPVALSQVTINTKGEVKE